MTFFQSLSSWSFFHMKEADIYVSFIHFLFVSQSIVTLFSWSHWWVYYFFLSSREKKMLCRASSSNIWPMVTSLNFYAHERLDPNNWSLLVPVNMLTFVLHRYLRMFFFLLFYFYLQLAVPREFTGVYRTCTLSRLGRTFFSLLMWNIYWRELFVTNVETSQTFTIVTIQHRIVTQIVQVVCDTSHTHDENSSSSLLFVCLLSLRLIPLQCLRLDNIAPRASHLFFSRQLLSHFFFSLHCFIHSTHVFLSLHPLALISITGNKFRFLFLFFSSLSLLASRSLLFLFSTFFLLSSKNILTLLACKVAYAAATAYFSVHVQVASRNLYIATGGQWQRWSIIISKQDRQVVKN